MAFFASTTSSNALKNSQVLKDVDVFIQKFEYEGLGVASIVSDDITLTPAVSPAFTVSELVSTVPNNIVVVADSAKVLEGKVDANDAVSVTFDATLTSDFSDGSAGDPTDFTATNSYEFYALTPSSTAGATYGDFFGWTNEITINAEEEFAEFKRGVPRQLKNQCLLEKTISITGNNSNLSNGDIVKTLWNMTERGDQTAQTELQTGFDPGDRGVYRITLVGENKEGKETIYQFYRTKVRPEGSLNLSEEGFKTAGWSGVVESDDLRPDAFNAFRYIIAD